VKPAEPGGAPAAAPATARASAIIFADVAGSSRIYKESGDIVAQRVIGVVVAEMAATIQQHGGRVIKTIGDEVMACFDAASPALASAIAIQRQRSQAEPRLEVRIGVHFGQALHEGADVFGDAVNTAAALVRIARGGQIITSRETVTELPADAGIESQPFDRVVLKGGREPSLIYAVAWEPQALTSPSTQVIMAITQDLPSIPDVAVLELEYRGQRVGIRPDQTPFIVGRDQTVAHLAIDDVVASRDHFRIEFRRGKFVLADRSTNGTWVRLAGQPPLYLRREELPLTGSGVISVGKPVQEDDPNLLSFRV
jgi:adenylate cyclase